MKICIISHEYPPFPGGGIATYHEVTAKHLVEAGHDVHVVTNRARHGASDPYLTERRWNEGRLTIHRLSCFDEYKTPPDNARFFNTDPYQHGDRDLLWAYEPSNLTAYLVAEYVKALHGMVKFDVIESPEYFAEAFYIVRRRSSGGRKHYPPICIVGHISTRLSLETSGHIWQLGCPQFRNLMLREEYCIQNADALQTPSHSLMEEYNQRFKNRLPNLRAVIPYPLDVPERWTSLPSELRNDKPFLLCIGRIEPRKGSDVAVKAFASLADEFPNLRLAFLGKEAWRHGQSFSDILVESVPRRHLSRILLLGNVPREQAIAAAREAVAFLHPAPWDNYPCAVLEAMHVGATCIVSDSGGQAEMIEDGRSGLITPSDDPESLANAIRRILKNANLKENLSRGAKKRSQKITNKERIVEAKINLFSTMIEKENKERGGFSRIFSFPRTPNADGISFPLPPKGMFVLDASFSDSHSIQISIGSIQDEVLASPGWKVRVLLDREQIVDLPEDCLRQSPIDTPPWLEIPDDHVVVYVMAGTRLDKNCLFPLISQVHQSPFPCGSFLWLRAAKTNVFPYKPDFSFHDLLLCGGILPPVFAVRAAHLHRCKNLTGLDRPSTRLCALMAASAAGGDLIFQHTGDVCGEFCGELPQVDKDVQIRAAGYLGALQLLSNSVCSLGNLEFPGATSPEDSTRFPEFENAYREHQALKKMLPVRLLRKFGVLNLLRRIFPRIKKAVGSG